MDNPQPTAPLKMPSAKRLGPTILKAIGFGLLLTIPMAAIATYGTFTFIGYFQLYSNAGLGAIFIPYVVLFYALCANAVLMTLATFITLERSSRPFLHALLIGLIINGLYVVGGWGVNFVTHINQLDTLAAQRNNDRYVATDSIADCAKVTDIDYWRSCISDKVTNATSLSTCEQQVAIFSGQAATVNECAFRYAANTGNPALCTSTIVHGSTYEDQGYCIFYALEKNWELNNRKTSMAAVESCAQFTDGRNQQFCYVASLRQLEATDAAAKLACQSITTTPWYFNEGMGPQDRDMVEEKCHLSIPTS